MFFYVVIVVNIEVSCSFMVQVKMHYYRYENAEVSCCYKYLMFSYNIIFWVSFILCLLTHRPVASCAFHCK